MVVYGNSIDVSAEFNTNDAYTKTESNLVISRSNDTLQAYFPTSGAYSLQMLFQHYTFVKWT